MSLKQMYKNLEQCAEQLERDVRNSLEDLQKIEKVDEQKLALDKAKDNHYKEILNLLNKIKVHVGTIAYHDRQIRVIDNRGLTKIDKEYVRRQIENFDVKRREKSVRSHHESNSMKYLATWEKYMDQHFTDDMKSKTMPIKKRSEYKRKEKKIISSTVESFLDRKGGRDNNNIPEKPGEKSQPQLGQIYEEHFAEKSLSDCELVKGEVMKSPDVKDDNNGVKKFNPDYDGNIRENTKPKIVDVTYKIKLI